MTFVAALRYDRISAPWVIDGPINGELFTLYVEHVLAPTLARGEIVILDNLGSHKGKPARNAIRATGAHLLFLPPYSPDLNPIEQVFAKLKHLLRAAEPRDVEATWRKVGELLDLIHAGVRQLLQKLRIRFRIKTSCSSDPKQSFPPPHFMLRSRSDCSYYQRTGASRYNAASLPGGGT